MSGLNSKIYGFKNIETKWIQRWEDEGIYRFDWSDTSKTVFSIDTPPPYPSGDFHMGNVLNWTYFDMVARYKRMRGFNVLFPQGWDCHGLPTEVRVEQTHGIKKSEVSSEEFVKLCKAYVEQFIGKMREAIQRFGYSIDWSTEYRTMDPDYWKRTQLSFVELYKKGLVYRGEHPVNWCPRCETAIADAEVEHEERKGRLYYVEFEVVDDTPLTIATTRPELIPACVALAVHPDDDRYRRYIGKKVMVPLFRREIKVLSDKDVDKDFGTGAVMICTYGDKEDVKWTSKYGLPVLQAITERGRMTSLGGEFEGLTILECRDAITKKLQDEGVLEREETISQSIGVCWRCKTPIEILERRQWFMATRKLTDMVMEETLKVKWIPDYMKWRQVNWAELLDWDWVISRQRVFATPIPAWYCVRCGEVIVAQESWLPVDPRHETPRELACTKCGSKELNADTDVFDTWMDSSITCAVHAGWPDRPDWRRFFPADLHPSGHEIIRTWAYYLMVRHLALFDEKPYKTVLINGMVLGRDGRKMSKSLGNYITAPEVLERHGADAARQWAAAGGRTGADVPFRWSDVEYGWRFLIKLWNVSRFIHRQLKDYRKKERSAVRLSTIDRWLLTKLERLTGTVTEAMENYEFNTAIENIRIFTWHVLCDQYIEAVKYRLYGEKDPEELIPVQYTLYEALFRILQLLAPICPFITEEIYHALYLEHEARRSIHLSDWPEYREEFIDDEAESTGELIVALINEIRRLKAQKQISLNASMREVTILADEEEWLERIRREGQEIKGTCRVEKLLFKRRPGQEGTELESFKGIAIQLVP